MLHQHEPTPYPVHAQAPCFLAHVDDKPIQPLADALDIHPPVKATQSRKESCVLHKTYTYIE
jgi:hypothetical protein